MFANLPNSRISRTLSASENFMFYTVFMTSIRLLLPSFCGEEPTEIGEIQQPRDCKFQHGKNFLRCVKDVTPNSLPVLPLSRKRVERITILSRTDDGSCLRCDGWDCKRRQSIFISRQDGRVTCPTGAVRFVYIASRLSRRIYTTRLC